jgi:hypothetical protein
MNVQVSGDMSGGTLNYPIQVSADLGSGVASLALGYVRFMSYLFGSLFFEMLLHYPWL